MRLVLFPLTRIPTVGDRFGNLPGSRIRSWAMVGWARLGSSTPKMHTHCRWCSTISGWTVWTSKWALPPYVSTCTPRWREPVTIIRNARRWRPSHGFPTCYPTRVDRLSSIFTWMHIVRKSCTEITVVALYCGKNISTHAVSNGVRYLILLTIVAAVGCEQLAQQAPSQFSTLGRLGVQQESSVV